MGSKASISMEFLSPLKQHVEVRESEAGGKTEKSTDPCGCNLGLFNEVSADVLTATLSFAAPITDSSPLGQTEPSSHSACQ